MQPAATTACRGNVYLTTSSMPFIDQMRRKLYFIFWFLAMSRRRQHNATDCCLFISCRPRYHGRYAHRRQIRLKPWLLGRHLYAALVSSRLRWLADSQFRLTTLHFAVGFGSSSNRERQRPGFTSRQYAYGSRRKDLRRPQYWWWRPAMY